MEQYVIPSLVVSSAAVMLLPDPPMSVRSTERRSAQSTVGSTTARLMAELELPSDEVEAVDEAVVLASLTALEAVDEAVELSVLEAVAVVVSVVVVSASPPTDAEEAVSVLAAHDTKRRASVTSATAATASAATIVLPRIRIVVLSSKTIEK